MIDASHDVEIVDPDLVICTLDDDAKINMEMTITTGKGYVPAVQMRAEDAPIGLIPIDAVYSPVRRVTFRVSNTRVGQVTDYDSLSLDVETDGTVVPDDAVALAARILQDQLQTFINFEEPTASVEADLRRSPGSTRTCCVRSMNWSFPFGRLIASRTTTSFISATWFRNPSRKCCAPRISGGNR